MWFPCAWLANGGPHSSALVLKRLTPSHVAHPSNCHLCQRTFSRSMALSKFNGHIMERTLDAKLDVVRLASILVDRPAQA